MMATYHNFLQSSETPRTHMMFKEAFYSQDPHWLSADAHDAGFWQIIKLSNFCSPWWPLPYFLGVGIVLLLHSFRSRSLSAWVTHTRHIFLDLLVPCLLGRPRRLVPGIARYIALRVTVFSYLLWTFPIQRRRPSSRKGVIMRRMSLFRMWCRLNTPRIPRSILTSVVAIFLLLFTFIAQHSLTYAKTGVTVWVYP